MDLLWTVFSAAFAIFMALRGYQKRSLSQSGALAGLFVGFLHMYAGIAFGSVLTAFYLSSTKLTKFKAELKEVVEENYKKASQRNIFQVLANSAASTVLLLLYLNHQDGDPRVLDAISAGFLGHFACCCADTWSSEIGIVSNESPRLITTFKKVPKGTNGAVSVLGTAAGAAGGLFMGVVFYIFSRWNSVEGTKLGLGLIFMGLTLGLLGTVLDSLLGGTLQYTGHSRKINRVVNKPGPEVTHITGMHILNNDAVNFVSSVLTATVAAYWAYARH